MFRRIPTFAVLLVLSFILASCGNFFGGVDETNIDKVAEYYFAPGKKMPDGKKTYHLLSEKTRAQIGEDQWVKLVETFQPINAVKVLRKEVVRGATYALVANTLLIRGEGMDSTGKKVPKEWKYIRTSSWILENGKWRRLNFPKTGEEVNRAFKNGDYAAVKAKSEEWLTLDPFSIEAYKCLIFAIARGGRTLPKEGAGSVDNIVRAVLAVNPEDTMGNFIAVTYTEEKSIAKSFLARLKGTTAYDDAAYNFAGKYNNPKERLAFLEDQEPAPNINMGKAITFAELRRWEEFRKLAGDNTFIQDTKKLLDSKDTSFSAARAAELGTGFLGAKDRGNAHFWFAYGLTKDPNDPQVRQLGRALGR